MKKKFLYLMITASLAVGCTSFLEGGCLEKDINYDRQNKAQLKRSMLYEDNFSMGAGSGISIYDSASTNYAKYFEAETDIYGVIWVCAFEEAFTKFKSIAQDEFWNPDIQIIRFKKKTEIDDPVSLLKDGCISYRVVKDCSSNPSYGARTDGKLLSLYAVGDHAFIELAIGPRYFSDFNSPGIVKRSLAYMMDSEQREIARKQTIEQQGIGGEQRQNAELLAIQKEFDKEEKQLADQEEKSAEQQARYQQEQDEQKKRSVQQEKLHIEQQTPYQQEQTEQISDVFRGAFQNPEMFIKIPLKLGLHPAYGLPNGWSEFSGVWANYTTLVTYRGRLSYVGDVDNEIECDIESSRKDLVERVTVRANCCNKSGEQITLDKFREIITRLLKELGISDASSKIESIPPNKDVVIEDSAYTIEFLRESYNIGYGLLFTLTPKISEVRITAPAVTTKSLPVSMSKQVPPSPKGNDITGLEIMAWVKCKRLVAERLTSPRSAKWPYNPISIESAGDRVFKIRAFVDSKNAFGVTVRNHFIAQVGYVDVTQWVLIDLKILE